MLEGIIIVSINYRLGPLGFASSGDRVFPGNYGLWDQFAALRFVRENIRHFGGDPKRITILGASAGAVSVATLGFSPASRDYFHQAVQMSGSVFASWAVNERVVNETSRLATELGCADTDESLDLKHCLRRKSIDEFYDAVARMGSTSYDVNFVKFGPRLDGVFFPRDFPELVMESLPKPTMMGFTEDDSLLFCERIRAEHGPTRAEQGPIRVI